jgi:hypothetical protein
MQLLYTELGLLNRAVYLGRWTDDLGDQKWLEFVRGEGGWTLYLGRYKLECFAVR